MKKRLYLAYLLTIAKGQHRAFASADLRNYLEVVGELAAQGWEVVGLKACHSEDEFMNELDKAMEPEPVH